MNLSSICGYCSRVRVSRYGSVDREPRQGRGPRRGTHTENQNGELRRGTKTGIIDREPRQGTKTGNHDGEQRQGTKTKRQD